MFQGVDSCIASSLVCQFFPTNRQLAEIIMATKGFLLVISFILGPAIRDKNLRRIHFNDDKMKAESAFVFVLCTNKKKKIIIND